MPGELVECKIFVAFLFAAGLGAAAIVGKLVTGHWPRARSRSDPSRGQAWYDETGEAGLVFASIGKALSVINYGPCSAIVRMVVLTMVIAPSLLKWPLCAGVTENGTLRRQAPEAE